MYVAGRSAVAAFRRSWDDPTAGADIGGPGARAEHYRYLWAYFTSEVYDDIYRYGLYKQFHGLYRATRAVYSPVRRLVDFYAGAVYPGVLSEDGDTLPDGVPLAIPLAKDTPDELKAAIAQLWQWANWQAGKSVYVRYGAALGNVLVEIVDELERGKVSAAVVWPGLLADLKLDGAGNVVSYALEYEVSDGTDRYLYRKEVDKTSFRTFKDSRPFAYDPDLGAEWDNPYGFVPAVWAKHSDVGSDFGAPAIDGSLGKVDELNSLASHVHDQVHKKVNMPALLAGVKNLTLLTGTQNRQPTAGMEFGAQERVLVDREDMLLIGADAGATVESLAGTLELDDALPLMTTLLGEIEQDHPELTLYKELRGMSQVTGPGAARLLGDASSRVYEAQANYDRGTLALFQMALAIGGFRANRGDWGRTLNRQQEKFRPFDLLSYERGDLDFAIPPRPLVLPTRQEHWQESLAMWQGAQAAKAAGVAIDVWARQEGWSDEDVAALKAGQDAAQQQALALARATPPPQLPGQQPTNQQQGEEAA